MQEIELVKGDCSHPPLNDDVSDVYFYDFSYYYIDYDDYDMHSDHESSIHPKWV